MGNISKLFTKVIVRRTVSFGDIYEQMTDEQKEAINNMSYKELRDFIDDNFQTMVDKFDAAVSDDWWNSVSIVASNLTYLQKQDDYGTT